MKNLVGNDEAKLVLALMQKKKEVPKDLKTKALEQLRVFSMSCEEGSAKGYLLDQMIDAIEANDIDKIVEIAELSNACINGADDSEDVFVYPETVEASKAAVDAFIEDMMKKDVPNGAIKAMIRKVIDNFIFVPLMYQDEVLAGFSVQHDCVLVFGVGFEGNMVELADKFVKIDEHVNMLRLIAKEFEIEREADTCFLAIQYNILSERELELVIRGLK